MFTFSFVAFYLLNFRLLPNRAIIQEMSTVWKYGANGFFLSPRKNAENWVSVDPYSAFYSFRYRSLLISLWDPSLSLSILAYFQKHSHMPIFIIPFARTLQTRYTHTKKKKLSGFRLLFKTSFWHTFWAMSLFVVSSACGPIIMIYPDTYIG